MEFNGGEVVIVATDFLLFLKKNIFYMKFISLTLAAKKGDIIVNPLQIVSLEISSYVDAKTIVTTSNPNAIYQVTQSIKEITSVIEQG